MRNRCRFRPLVLCAVALVFAAPQSSKAQQRAPTHLALGQQHAGKGQWKQAEEESRLELQQQPENEAAAVLHATALIQLGQPFDAALEMEEFLKRHPGSVAAGKLYAALLVDVVQDRAKAEQVLLHCSKLAPRDPAIWEGLGKLYIARHQEKDAIRCFQEAVRLAPANPVYEVGLALGYEKNSQRDQAELHYQRALRLNAASRAPDPVVYILYGNSLAAAERFASSIPYYTKALLLDPHSSDAYQGRALAYEKTGDTRRAEADALAALREAPRRKDSRQLLLRIYRATGDEAKLQQQSGELEKLVQSEQSELSQGRAMRAALNAAEPLLAQGRYAEAIPAYEQVIAADPAFYEAYFALGVCYQQTGQILKSEAALRKYLEFQPLSADGRAALGLVLAAAGRDADARTELEQALQLNPELVEPRKALAHLMILKREYAAAAAMLEPVIASGSADPQAYQMAVTARFNAGDKQKAMQVCEAGLRSFPRDVGLEERYAALLLDCSKTEACKLKAIESLKSDPSSPAYMKAVASMLIDASAIDPSTADMVQRTHTALPDDPMAQYLYAKWSLSDNLVEQAIREATRLTQMPNADTSAKASGFALIGVAQERLDHLDEADRNFRESLALNRKLTPPSPQIAMPYLDFLVKQSRPEDVARLAKEMLTWSPSFSPAHLRLAVYYANAGRAEDAIKEAQLALDTAGDDTTTSRGAHALLARTYMTLDRPAEAKLHQDWIVAH
jgi:tetratricopeptide (TPR) repeat protein